MVQPDSTPLVLLYTWYLVIPLSFLFRLYIFCSYNTYVFYLYADLFVSWRLLYARDTYEVDVYVTCVVNVLHVCAAPGTWYVLCTACAVCVVCAACGAW